MVHMMVIKAKINHLKDNARKVGIKMIPERKTKLQKTKTVRDGVKMVLVMELTKEMELLTSIKIMMDLKTGLPMERMIIVETTINLKIDIFKKVTETDANETELLTMILKSKTPKTRL
jgi:hypothetical protein